MMEDRDVVIMGGGPAGYTAAIRVKQLGGKATLIENDLIGGVCLNYGCIPIVSLGRAVELFEMGKSAMDYGITYKDITVDFQKMMTRKDTIVKTLVSGVKQTLEAYGIEVMEGTGKIISLSQIEVELKDGTKNILKPQKIIIATGSKYPKFSFPGGGKAIDSLEALKLKEIPRSMAIVGGGFIGSALATIFSRLGTKVCMVEESNRLLPQMDREIINILEKEFNDHSIQIYSKSHVISIAASRKDDRNVLINYKGEEITIEAQFLVMSEGRVANIEGLGLKEVGISLNEKGGILVNEQMETNLPGVYAAGDVTMEHMWTSAAYFEAITSAENAMGKNAKIDYKAIPKWAYTIPEISSVGMTEEKAIEVGYRVRIGRFPFAGNGMAAILGQRIGMVKVIKEEDYGEVLGVHMIGPRTADLIAEAALAMRVEGTPEEIAKTFHIHPSLSEALWEASRSV
jgi:dihydrolipoamide dehydrogenase